MLALSYGNLLRGDDRYNPRFTQEAEIRSFDGAIKLTGLMVPDSPEGIKAWPALPKLPFRFTVPANADYQTINQEVYRRIRAGESLWDLDFTGVLTGTRTAFFLSRSPWAV